MINKFIADICEILNIAAPIISFDTSRFSTQTMMAQCLSDGSIIYIKKFDELNPDYCFSIAHELRHAWQSKNNKELYFSDYKTANILDVEKYNLQLAEIDANAFASIIMVNFFHLQPQYNGLSPAVVLEIKERIKIIVTELSE